jgi:hypothetical protein
MLPPEGFLGLVACFGENVQAFARMTGLWPGAAVWID